MGQATRWIVALIAIGGGAAVGLGFAGPVIDTITGGGEAVSEERAPEAAPMAVAMQAVEERTFADRFQAVGTTEALRSVDIRPLSAGLVTEFDIPSGERVEAGFGLVQLDDRAERAALTQAEARLGEARSALERAQQLAAQDVATDASLESTQAAVQLAEGEFDAARNAVDDRLIRTPFAGTLGIHEIDLGQRLETTDVVVTLDDLSAVEITFNLPEALLSRVRPGLQITARGADGQAVEGAVETVGTRIDEAGRFFAVRGRFENIEEAGLATGMFMTVELVLEERRGPGVPETAIVSEGDRSVVFVAVDGKASEREVEIGLIDAEFVEVREGLEVGETIVTSGLQSLEDGDPVTAEADADEGTPVAEAEPVG